MIVVITGGGDLSFGTVMFPHRWSLSLRYNAIRRRGLLGGAPKSWTSQREHDIVKIAISGIVLNIAFTAIFFMLYFGGAIAGPPID